MRIKATNGGYKLWLSGQDTSNFARQWPCSTLGGEAVFIEVDSNGLCDARVTNVKTDDIDGRELEAIVGDMLPPAYREYWPVWGKQTVCGGV